MTHEFFATTAKGMEPFLADELRSLGAPAADVKETRAGVSFRGELRLAYKVCLWSRIANRVLLPLKTFPAPDPAKLYGGVKSIRWSEHLDAKRTLAVDFASSRSQITHTHFGALKVKDAIVDQLRSTLGERPNVDPSRPDVRVNVHLNADVATVSIDLSGDSLHKRGYRAPGGAEPGPRAPGTSHAPASLKENLAAAILMAAGWPKHARENPDAAFLDPMCGSGTLPIEAAMMAANRAPGLRREYHGFVGWVPHAAGVWKELLEEARDLEIRDKKKLPRIEGTDRDFRAVRTALANVERAGFTGRVHIEKREFSDSKPSASQGLIVLNPPYGERLGEIEELMPVYEGMGDIFKQRFKGWDGAVFTGSPELSKVIGLRAARRVVFYNGAIECRLFTYELY